jgi:hypothetical protein
MQIEFQQNLQKGLQLDTLLVTQHLCGMECTINMNLPVWGGGGSNRNPIWIQDNACSL